MKTIRRRATTAGPMRAGLARAGLALATVMLISAPAVAQQGPPQRGPMDRAQIERRIMAQFRTLVGNELGIDSVTTDALFGVVEQMQGARRDLHLREVRLDRRLNGTGVYLSDERSAEALAEFLAIKREELRLLEREHARLGEVLTPGQLLRFYTLREEMGDRIRRLRGGERGPRGTPSG